MPMVKTARASVVTPHIEREGWAKVRTAAKAEAKVSENLIARASEIFGKPFVPSEYLLTHATIVASVDTFEPPNVKLGKVMEGGFRVNRKYGNYRVKLGCDKYINNNCFIPGTLITMADGTVKPIEDVQVGDTVLTHKGRARRVTETFQHNVEGELLEIKVRGSNEQLFVTPGHPFFAFRSNTECVACGGQINRKPHTVSHLLGKHYCSKECYYQHRVPNATLLRGKDGQFTEASSLTTNDFSAMPVVGGEQDVGLTLGQARLIGLFAAEGYYELDSRNDNERVGVCWAFHEDERHTLAQTVCDMMQTEFGIECVIRPHSNDRGIHVTTKTCRKAVEFFSRYIFGGGATTKWLHQDLLTAPVAVQMEILRGWFEGDGSAFDTGAWRDVPGDFRLTGTSASQGLANQMRILLHRQGIAPRMHHTVSEGRRRLVVDGAARVVSDPSKECHSWVVSCGAGYIGDMVQDTVYADAYEAAAEVRGGFQQSPDLRFLNGYCLQMFTGISSVEYRGPVYNFETDEDHSYIAGGVAVHNCDAWDRNVLLASYRTFIGGHNFVEHVQLEELSKGRIIDAVARDLGDSVYVDILIATDRKHTDLVKAIESGKMSTMSMGCFLPGTLVTMADGRRVPIEDVQPGDVVLTHKGRAREVLNKQIKGGKWDMRTVHAVGLASPITSTGNHPYYVLRPADVCACGCGESLPAYAPAVKKPTTRSLTRRFKRGHDKRILNPNNTYSMEDFKRRKAQMGEIQNPELVKVRADDLQVGDFIAFPRVRDGEHTVSVSEGKARLLGYFLAEGSFNKRKGRRMTVVFSFSMEEKDTFVAEVVRLLGQEFPGKNKPWVQDRVERNTCVVYLTSRKAADWFHKHGGEYSHGKRLSADAMNWSQENHKHLIGTWLNGDGHRAKAHGGFLVGTTVSLDLASQMHALMAKCGWFARFEARIGSKSVTVAKAINGGVAVRDEATGRLPAFLLTIGNTQSVELQGYCAKAPTTSKYGTQNNRTFDDWVVSPITAIEESTYEGWVHDMEVDEDHTYIVEGASVSNCTVDGTICTKCGHWAADETEMCFPMGTRVLTGDGKYVPIEEVVEGDLVVTHTGAVQPVLHTMGRHHDGHVTVLNVEGVPQLVQATTGHRFWVLRRGASSPVWVEAKEIRPGDFLVIPSDTADVQASPVGTWWVCRVAVAWNECFSGQVHNIEVAGDESYVVEGLAVHNCPHIKYEKGNTFFDEQGRQHRVAELCFPPGFRVVLADGVRRAIEDIQVGDIVLSHTGRKREVSQTFERHYDGSLVCLDVVGIPQPLKATPQHPFLVLSPRTTCKCGCGAPLGEPRGAGERRDFLRSYVQGHHPNGSGVVSLEIPPFEFKAASEIRVGDLLTLPVAEATGEVEAGVSEEKAWLLGWFLAEGSFLKSGGHRKGVQFTLNAADEQSVADEIAAKLQQLFPPEKDARRGTACLVLEVLANHPATTKDLGAALGKKPRHLLPVLNTLLREGVVSRRKLTSDEKVQRGLRRKGVVYVWAACQTEIPAKSPAVYNYERPEGGRKLVVVYRSVAAAHWFFRHAGEYAGNKRISSAAVEWPPELQMALLRGYVGGDGACDVQGRISVSSVSDDLISQIQVVASRCGFWTRRQVVFGGKAVDLLSVVGGGSAPVDSRGWRPLHTLHFQPSQEASDALGGRGFIRNLSPAWRYHKGHMLYRVRGVSEEVYSGPVHNIEVAEDHSYLVEGMAVHNCGHPSLDPTGGVHFSEASWVGTAAFTGAVLNKILTMNEGNALGKAASVILATPPDQWTKATRRKAAALAYGGDVFMAGWDDEDEGGGEDEAPAKDEPKEPFQDMEEDLVKYMRDRVRKRLKKDMDKKEQDEAMNLPDSADPNDSIVKQAAYSSAIFTAARFSSNDAALMDRVATLDAEHGISIPVPLYRAALRLGSSVEYEDLHHFARACHAVLGRKPTAGEAKVLIRLGKLISLRGQDRRRDPTSSPLTVATAKETIP